MSVFIRRLKRKEIRIESDSIRKMETMWSDSALIYQIYPLGAAGAPFENDHQFTHRLPRFEKWIDHLKDLRVDCVLFNPLFESSTHGYDTIDYRKVDCRLGDEQDLKHLTQTLHENGMKVMFDGVFNHVGRDFGPFQDVLKNREGSRYKDWFVVDFNGNNSYNDGLWYANWEGYDALVKLNLANPEVVQYLLDTMDYWIDTYGVDGLRLDVAYCLDQNFLRALHNHVKSRDPEFFLMGETLHGDYNTWCNPEMCDSVTNYECYKGIYSSFNSTNFYEILYSFNRQFGKEPWCLYTGKHLMCFLDNHDVPRIATILQNPAHLPLAWAMVMTMPGIPAIYYGSEWGIKGDKGNADRDIRPEVKMPESNELTKLIEKISRIRHEYSAYSNGDYTQIAINNGWCIYQRANDQETLWTVINMTDQPVSIPVSLNGQAKDLMEDVDIEINNHVDLAPQSFKLLQIR